MESVNFEMARNGQVFFINNRIEGLYRLEEMLHRLVPDARVIVAHGQMPPEKLEKSIIDFAAHDYDILLSTTIVESGVDMPNVNTIIINNAQNFGLSEAAPVARTRRPQRPQGLLLPACAPGSAADTGGAPTPTGNRKLLRPWQRHTYSNAGP